MKTLQVYLKTINDVVVLDVFKYLKVLVIFE